MIGYNACSFCLFTVGGELRKVLTSRKVTDGLNNASGEQMLPPCGYWGIGFCLER